MKQGSVRRISTSPPAPQAIKLTMQINIDGDPLPTNDFAYATPEGLVPPRVERTGEACIKANGLTGPFDEIEFDLKPTP